MLWDSYQQMNAIMVILGTSIISYYKFWVQITTEYVGTPHQNI
jgi:hypothetical protein